MKHSIGRSELWERSLASLEDAIFFDIAKNFIGRIPTPFHKPQIIDRLTTLFSSDEFVGRVEKSLSELDRKLLTGAALLGSATQDQLCSLHAHDFDYASLQQGIVNLEERLLLIPDPDSFARDRSIMPNPLIFGKLSGKVLSLSCLFDPAGAEEPERKLLVSPVDRRLIRALASLHLHDGSATMERNERMIISKHAQHVFRMNGQMEIERLLAYHHLLVLEGALAVRGKKSTLDIDRIGHLLQCEEKQLAWKLFKAACLKGRIETDIGALRLFHATITRVLEHAAIRSDLTLRRLCLLAALRSKLPIELVDTLMRLLRVAGLQESGSGPLCEAHEIMMKPTIDSDLTISFTSDVVPVDGKDLLHVIAIVRTVDVVTSYEVNRATILRAFDNGLSTEQLCSYLKGLTGSLPLSLERLINQWREEFSRITIYDGVVVKTDERLGRILKAHPSLREHLLEEISPDVFLFPRNTEQQWRQIIASTGIGVLPSSIGTKEPQREEAEAEKEPEVFDEPLARALHDLARTRRSEPAASEPVFLDELREAINKKTLSRTEREELLARLERRLILLPSQIAASDGRTQTMEASGFDYQGKINLSKATVNSAAYLLELSVLDPDGTPQVLMTEVKEFIKDAREAAIRVRILPAGEEKVFSIGKIFRMRRLRRSIFLQV